MICTGIRQNPTRCGTHHVGEKGRFVLNVMRTGGILDLNTAAVELEVQKRRIYDITNVLEVCPLDRPPILWGRIC